MPINSFAFGSTHSWDDHRTVKWAVETVNGLPSYAGGHVRLGSSFSIGTIEGGISQMKSFEASQEKRIENERCQGYSAEVLGKSKEVLAKIREYISALETIRDYMQNYRACGC